MVDYKTVFTQLDEVLNLVSGALSETQVNDIRVYLNAGEWGLTLEFLCDLLYEDEIPIPRRAYELLQETGTTLNLTSQNWEVLKPQIINNFSSPQPSS